MGVNLAVAWVLIRRNSGPGTFFDSVTARASSPDRDGAVAGVGSAAASDGDGAGDEPGESIGRRDPPPLDAEGETVVCRHCGAENRDGFRYCRWCVRSGFVDEGAGVTAGTAMADRSS
ncbi:hypothetical protein GCM10008994_21890 [Halorubrum ejinorense]